MRATSATAARAGTAAGGDAVFDSALDGLFQTHYLRLVRVAWLLLRDAGRAEEIVQDAFVDLCGRWTTMRVSSDPGGYLYVAVVNRLRSVLRRVRVARAAQDQLERTERLADPEASAEASALHALQCRRVVDGLALLPRRQREVLVLRYYADLSEAETAGVLGIGRGSVKSHSSRGVHALRQLLGGRDEI